VRIVVLVKPVPDPASAGERLGPDGRLDRAAVPAVVNGNDEYVLEAALKLVEAAGEGEITLLSMAPTNAPETLRKALAMGAHRGVHEAARRVVPAEEAAEVVAQIAFAAGHGKIDDRRARPVTAGCQWTDHVRELRPNGKDVIANHRVRYWGAARRCA